MPKISENLHLTFLMENVKIKDLYLASSWHRKIKLISGKVAPIGVAAPEKAVGALITIHIADVFTKLGILKGLVSQSQRLLCTKSVTENEFQ